MAEGRWAEVGSVGAARDAGKQTFWGLLPEGLPGGPFRSPNSWRRLPGVLSSERFGLDSHIPLGTIGTSPL